MGVKGEIRSTNVPSTGFRIAAALNAIVQRAGTHSAVCACARAPAPGEGRSDSRTPLRRRGQRRERAREAAAAGPRNDGDAELVTRSRNLADGRWDLKSEGEQSGEPEPDFYPH